MAWSTSSRRQTLPKNWDVLRLVVMRRDNWQCQWKFPNGGRCGRKANQCDHIDRRGGDDSANLRALCEEHHNRKSAGEGWAARQEVIAAARAVVARVPEPEPAVVDAPGVPLGRRGF